MTGSAGQKRVPSLFFEKFTIGIPAPADTEKFAKIMSKIEKQKSLIQKENIHLDNLFHSLQQRAFKGEL
jgi:type I restriction enzyme, S subunit